MAKAPDIQVIVIDPLRQTVEKRWIPNTLQAMQQLVGGSIQPICPQSLGGEVLYCNEEGKWDCPDTFLLRTWEHDPLHGTCFIVGESRGNNKSTSWSPEEIEEFVTWPSVSTPTRKQNEALEALPGYGSF